MYIKFINKYKDNSDFSFRKICPLCESRKSDSKEHIFPEWLILRTNTHKTSIKWINGKEINPLSATIPICKTCNQILGRELESPVQHIFHRVENGEGINDYDADLLVRWMWKISKLFYKYNHPKGKVTSNSSLFQFLINPISQPRNRITLAIALINELDQEFNDAPMGIDTTGFFSGVLVAGVFSKIAIIVTLTDFASLIPPIYSTYTFSKKIGGRNEPRLMIPNIGFLDCTSAVGITTATGKELLRFHEKKALNDLISAGIIKI